MKEYAEKLKEIFPALLYTNGIIVVAFFAKRTMENNNESRLSDQQGQQGTGSAENTGRNREDQKNNMTEPDQSQRQDVANDTGLSPDDISDMRELGTLSGRDDYAGTTSDGMDDQDTDEETDR